MVGRENELLKLCNRINLLNKSINIVTGRYGVGKTSFLNIVQFQVFQQKDNAKILPSYRKVRIDNKTTYKEFLIEIILAFCENIREFYIQSRRRIPDSIKFQVDYWLGIRSNNYSTGREFELDLQLISQA